jgi:putative two-component system response regulator
MNAQQILVVDDCPRITALLERMLKDDGHQVSVAADGQEALAAIAASPPDLILTDLDMPHVSGFELCNRVKRDPATRLIPILIITGEQAFAAKLRGWELGADDFLTKPFDRVEVLARCRSLLRLKRLVDELDSAEGVVFAFARTVEAKCRCTWGHSERVALYASMMASDLGLSEADQTALRKGAVLHDIGKICIPDAILNKPGVLTRDEFEIVKEHPIQGTHIVEPLRSIRDAIPLIRWHHERLDGQGYPDGLVGDAIPITARILAVADVYDALSSERPYRLALPQAVCIRSLCESANGGGLDPTVVRCFCQHLELPAGDSESHSSAADLSVF